VGGSRLAAGTGPGTRAQDHSRQSALDEHDPEAPHLAGHAGLEAKPTDAGGQGFSGTWCGNVAIDGLVYRVQRAPRLRMAMLDEHARRSCVLHSATYVDPVTSGVEVVDPRDDRRQRCAIEPTDERPVDLLRLDLATPEEPAPREAGPELT